MPYPIESFTVVSVLRMIKFFAWESRMEERIKDRRTDELESIRWRRMLDLVTGILKLVFPLTRVPR